MRAVDRARRLGVPVDELPDGRGRHAGHARGSAHPRWNHRILNEAGYVMVRVGHAHPLANPKGYAFEHVLVAVTALGRPLHPDETVHHREDEHGVSDKTDNRWENLVVLTKSEHARLHAAEFERDEAGRFTGKHLGKSGADGPLFFAQNGNDIEVVAPVAG